LPPLLYGSGPQFSPTGHLLYTSSAEEGVVTAVPFQIEKLQVLGPPKVVLQGLRQENGAQDSPAQFALSKDGTLIYATGRNAARTAFVTRHRSGGVDSLPLPPGDYGSFRLSPDGRYLLISVWAPGADRESFIVDLTHETRVRVPFRANSGQTAWWPGSKTVLVTQLGEGGLELAVRVSARDGAMVDTLLREAVASASFDSSRVLVRRTNRELWLYWRDGSRPPIKVANPPAWFASFSPNGDWILYTDIVEGRSEQMVARASDPAERYQISRAGGEEGIWSRAGDEIVFREGNRWFRVRVSTRGKFSYDAPTFLFEGNYSNVPGWSHDLTPDGGHLLLAGPPEQTTTQLNVVTNFHAELRRLAPPSRR
jgi:hypothetical protein